MYIGIMKGFDVSSTARTSVDQGVASPRQAVYLEVLHQYQVGHHLVVFCAYLRNNLETAGRQNLEPVRGQTLDLAKAVAMTTDNWPALRSDPRRPG